MAARLERLGAKHIDLPLDKKDLIGLTRNAYKLRDIAREHGVTLIHARSRGPAISAHWAADKLGLPFVTTFHAVYGLGSGPFAPLLRPIKRAYNGVMTKADRIIAISRFVQNHIIDDYRPPADRIRLIPRGIDLELFDPAAVSAQRLARLVDVWNLPDDRKVLLLPGRLVMRKGHTVLIDALARLKRDDLLTVFVGEEKSHGSYRSRLEKLIAGHDLTGQVRFVGGCDDMPAAYRLASLVIAPSTVPEAFGRVPVEALAMGRAVIAADHGGFPETLEHGRWGRLTPPGDAAALAAAIEEALNEGEWSDTHAAAAREHVLAHYSKRQMTEATLDVYEELLG